MTGAISIDGMDIRDMTIKVFTGTNWNRSTRRFPFHWNHS